MTAFGSNITLTNELSNGNLVNADRIGQVHSIEDLELSSSTEEFDSDEQWTRTIPTVFHWDHGGQDVFLTGSFSDWNARIPMNSRYMEHEAFSGGFQWI